MRRLKRGLWRYLPGTHPGMEQLVSWADGLPYAGVEPHLAHCERCRTTSESLRAAVRAKRESNTAGRRNLDPLLHDVYRSLEQQMRWWCSPGARRQHWIRALEFYFGKELARQSGAAGATPATRALLHAFLGRKAADAVTCQITGAI